jgi:hypothetical protein
MYSQEKKNPARTILKESRLISDQLAMASGVGHKPTIHHDYIA